MLILFCLGLFGCLFLFGFGWCVLVSYYFLCCLFITRCCFAWCVVVVDCCVLLVLLECFLVGVRFLVLFGCVCFGLGGGCFDFYGWVGCLLVSVLGLGFVLVCVFWSGWW